MYTIMIVDDNETELVIAQKTLEKNYQIIPMNNSKQALARLAKATIMPDLMLLDIAMPGINGFEMIMRLKTSEKAKGIPVLFLSGDKENGTELEAYRLGAVDFIRKPVVAELLRKRVELQINLLEYKKKMSTYNTQLQQTASYQAQNALRLEYFIIGIITDLIARKDSYTGMHSIYASKHMGILLKEMLMSGVNYGIASEDYDLILLSSQLHDMGKIGVPDSVLQKEGKYTKEEFELMKSHTIFAADAIQKYSYLLPNSKFLNYTYQMARYHHERFDGNGYPDRLSGQNIPILAMILSVADVYDALISERSYREPLSHEQAYNIITQGAGVQFDPQVVAAFQRVHMDLYEASQKMAMAVQQQGDLMSRQQMSLMPGNKEKNGKGK
ncbi:MAG TPA: response regulator [Lachnospiraceae bacterium]|nr:response regulator [Lachnospiraceae bacterium]